MPQVERQGELIYFISGMWCSSCAKNLKEGVQNIKGVREANVNYASKLLHVEVDTPYYDSIDQLIQTKINKIGFTARKQTSGWIAEFKKNLENELDNKLSWVFICIVWFLSMWATMFSFSHYFGGELSSTEIYKVAVVSAFFGIPAILLGIYPTQSLDLELVV